MVDLHDEAERLALAFVREFKRTFPGKTPAQALQSFGVGVSAAIAPKIGWDDVVSEWAGNWLRSRRSQPK